MTIIFASNNISKLQEIRKAFESENIEIKSLDDVGLTNFDIEETGQTYAENAFIKAKAVYERTGIPAIGDDSGIEVDYLNGEPGVFSHRWHGNDDPCQKMINALKGVPYEKRKAHYKTTLCYYNGNELYVDDVIHGHLLEEAKGHKGFSYDGIFLPDGFDKTFGELNLDVKNEISARGKAARRMAQFILAEEELMTEKIPE